MKTVEIVGLEIFHFKHLCGGEFKCPYCPRFYCACGPTYCGSCGHPMKYEPKFAVTTREAAKELLAQQHSWD